MAEIAPAVSTAVVQAYYPEALKEADSARARAQNGYTIAGAVAAAIVAAGVFGDIGKERDYVQALGVLALAIWLLAGIFFLSAVAGRVTLPGPAEASNVDTFVTAVLNRATNERPAIEKRIGMALVTTYVAVAVTLIVLVLALVTEAPATTKQGSLALTRAGSATVESLCGGTHTAVSAELDPATLGDLFTDVKVDGCGTPPKVVTLRLAKRDIAGFAAN